MRRAIDKGSAICLRQPGVRRYPLQLALESPSFHDAKFATLIAKVGE